MNNKKLALSMEINHWVILLFKEMNIVVEKNKKRDLYFL